MVNRRGQRWLIAIAMMVGGVCLADEFKVVQDSLKFYVENQFYRLMIDTMHGGAVRSFVYKSYDPDKEWIYAEGGGLLEDMIWQQAHPGELQDHPYEYKVLEQSPAVFRVEMWRAFKQDPYPGLICRKVIALRADSPAIQATLTLENPTTKDLFPGAWIQNRFYCGGQKGVQVAYRPSNLGIRMVYVRDGRCYGDEFVRKPAGGWAMTFDSKRGAGMLALVDYNYLRMHYSCITMYTTEWFYDRVLLPPGKKWSTQCLLVPVKDVFNCYYGDERIFITADQKGEELTLNVRATDVPVKETAITVLAESADRTAKLGEVTNVLKDVKAVAPQPIKLRIPRLDKDPVVISLKTVTEGKTQTAEFMYSADPTRYFAPESASPYRAPLPRKIKPELSGERKLSLAMHDGVAVLYAAGLWHEFNRISEMLKQAAPNATVKETCFKSAVLGPELTYQPLLAEELLGYDLIVLNNVGADALGDAGEIAVEQYVKAGGALWVCGGVCSLGKARFAESPLAAVLPVETAGFFDLERLPAFERIVNPASTNADLGHVEWIQRAKSVKTNMVVLLTVSGKPLLVSGAYGKGKVCVWLGTPMGEPPKDKVPYWDNAGWLDFMKQALSKFLPGSQ